MTDLTILIDNICLYKALTAEQVDEMIAALPKTIAKTDEAAVKEARGAYERLTSEQKTLVSNLDVLEAAEKALAQINASLNADAAKAVEDKIAALPQTISKTDEAAVKEVRAAYDALTKTQKDLVNNYAVLEAAEKVLAQINASLDADAAKAVEDKITALPQTITKTDEVAVKEARAAYDALTSKQKQLVKNLDKLQAAEADLEKLQKQRGDINGDGAIDSLDALMALRYSVGLETLSEAQIFQADVTKDGAVDSFDALDILRYSVGIIKEF